MRFTPLLSVLAAISLPVSAAMAQAPVKAAIAPGMGVPAAMSTIREADLKTDLYAMAGLDMRGREAGTLDEMRASMWVADALRKIGVKPAGTDGSYFQWWNMRRTRISTVSSSAKIGARTLALWADIVPNGNNAVEVSGQTVWGGDGLDSTLDVRGKVVIAQLSRPGTVLRPEGTNSYEYRYATAAMSSISTRFQRRGAVAIVLVADSIADIAFQGVAAIRARGAYDVPGGVPRNGTPAPNAAGRGGNAAAGGAGAVGAGAGAAGAGGRGGAGRGGAQTPNAPVFLVRSSMLSALRGGGEAAEFKVRLESFDAPSVNIVGKIAGTDPKLRDEYVL
ncbi:MAG: hypothetical protein ABI120_18505, partial [Gemmatimonadaceae bacterium]